MADEKKDDPTVEPEPHEQGIETLPPETQSYIKSLRAEAANNRKKARDLAEKLQGQSAQAEEAQRAALAEQGKYKELYEKEHPVVEALTKEIESYRAEAQKRKDALLEKLPEEKRELYRDATMSILEDVVASLSPKDSPKKPDKPGGGGEDKTYEEMTNAERIALKASNPALYRKQYSEWYVKKNGTQPKYIP